MPPAPPPHTRLAWKRLGRALAALRWRRGASLEDVHRASGLPTAAIFRYENGEKLPTPPTVRRLLGALDYGPSALSATWRWQEETERSKASATARQTLRVDWAWQHGSRAAALLERIATHLESVEPPESIYLRAAVPEPADREHARALRRRLERHPEPRWRRLFAWAVDFRHAGLCELLCLESLDLAVEVPERAFVRAGLALELARMLPDPAGLRWRALGFAGYCLANAWRARGDLVPARDAREEAERSWQRRGPSPLFPEARVLGLQGSFLRSEQQYSAALACYEAALGALDGADAAGRPALWIGKALTLKEMGSFDAALALLIAAAREVAPSNLRLQLALGFNRAVLFGHLGWHPEAAALLPQLREQAERLGPDLGHLVRARVDWLEARVARDLGEIERAVTAFERARRAFAERADACDEALVTLELASVLAATGQADEARELARGLVRVFEGQGLPGPALDAQRLAS
jgi:tetratricopeptide (TPR) repeat protein